MLNTCFVHSCLQTQECTRRLDNSPGVLQVSRAGDLADWLVRKSLMHPALRGVPIMYDMNMGGYDDPTTRNSEVKYEHLTIQLQRAAYLRAHRLVRWGYQPATAPPQCQ
jgi:hypothetical protein